MTATPAHKCPAEKKKGAEACTPANGCATGDSDACRSEDACAIPKNGVGGYL